MRLLILGGTEFVGRAVTEAALARGWRVTVFHRGHHEAPAGVTTLRGDRTAPGGLAALSDLSGLSGLSDGADAWDAVVDTWSAAPSAVLSTARLLADRVGRYVYISSRSVYANPAPAGLTEDGPLVEGASAAAGQTAYPQDKRGGELAAEAVFGDRALLVRAGLILGPGENIGRLPWWLGRIARGGPVLAPGPRDNSVQYIDARDLAEWTLDAVRDGLGGPYNLVSPAGHTSMGELLDACVRVTGSDAELRWTDPETILAAGIEPWSDLPVWIPPGEMHDTLHGSDVSKALATGLRCRPVAETVADTWSWLGSIGGRAPQRPDRPPVGLAPEVEAEVLARQGLG
ncbi:NAD-dependent epimerase/dehydratase family protein [Streptomyces sp. 35G-GA-8]|uniref:NAD-dependent epimerase/dehydratase family protein n=1 Tax=Streptomyces sp. 35G-GA-8 TaxID=2939434 RepID=UPI00201EF123|nr:NAD-dependent epimerase/dehydratase family protein [Streptomyces sp. 35G-GA-8]MCL7378950.1 NAD-dependent epimerase/dehydratase family protein [Streptomyces sp. 35G-GA-8]